jgi:hypothetical protein
LGLPKALAKKFFLDLFFGQFAPDRTCLLCFVIKRFGYTQTPISSAHFDSTWPARSLRFAKFLVIFANNNAFPNWQEVMVLLFCLSQAW